MRIIAVARRGFGRHLTIDLREVLRRQADLHGTKRLSELVAATRSDQGNDVRAAGENPADRDLGDRGDLRCGDLAQRLHERQVAVQVFSGEARQASAEVAGRLAALPGPVPADETAR